MSKKIVIAEYISTGINYVYDAISRGYEPVVIDCPYVGKEEDVAALRADRASIRAKLPPGVTVIEETNDYEALLRQVRELAPVLVIAGSEFGVPFATRLAADLGLPGNPVSRLPEMTEKDAMHAALEAHGIRCIRGRLIQSVEEARAYYEELGVQHVVIKRMRGAGTQGVYLCSGLEEALGAVEKELSFSIENGDRDGILLMQEQIRGVEYIVNTLSCGGKHRLASMWRYDKVRLANMANAYNYCRTINRLEIGHTRLVQYAFDVLDAIGIQYGPVHGEFMIDEKGPVLIEVNCRPMGAGLGRKFTDLVFGHHETDVALDCYLDPAKFEADMNKPYRPLRKGAIKFFILPQDVVADTTPVLPISRRVRSFYSGHFESFGRQLVLPQTQSIDTAGGKVYLVHEDERTVIEDCDLLHRIEMEYPDILFQDPAKRPPVEGPCRDIQEILSALRCGGSTLVFSDRDREVQGATVIGESGLRTAYDSYDQGVLDLSRPETFADLEILITQIYEFSDKIREGGRLIIPESTYRNLPYGAEGMEILLQITGLRIEPPHCGLGDVMIASVDRRTL